MTRAQFVTIAWRAAGSPAPTGTAPFADTDPGAYYAEAVDWAFAAGLVGGVTPTTFEPDGPLDRRTALLLMYRLETMVDPPVV
ncbi:MAG: S-layer homology domain-containing protein [Actinomyces sp.]|nr:MAG: S-layer homology domain-containing protein [Actinomyces sp.]